MRFRAFLGPMAGARLVLAKPIKDDRIAWAARGFPFWRTGESSNL